MVSHVPIPVSRPAVSTVALPDGARTLVLIVSPLERACVPLGGGRLTSEGREVRRPHSRATEEGLHPFRRPRISKGQAQRPGQLHRGEGPKLAPRGLTVPVGGLCTVRRTVEIASRQTPGFAALHLSARSVAAPPRSPQ